MQPVGLGPEAAGRAGQGPAAEPQTLVIEPAPSVDRSPRPTAPVVIAEPDPVVVADLDPGVPDLFETDLFADVDGPGTTGPAGIGSAVARPGVTPPATTLPGAGAGFLPPPALVPADAPDVEMSTTTLRASELAAAAGALSAPAASDASAAGAATVSRPGKRRDRRPSWLIPVVGAAAIVAGGLYILAGRGTDKTASKSPSTSAKVATVTTVGPGTTSGAAVTTAQATSALATTVASTGAPVTTVAPSIAPTTLPSPSTASVATTALPATTAPAATTVPATEGPPVPLKFPPPTVVTGTGNRTFKITLAEESSPVLLQATHKGTRNFIVKALDAKGAALNVPINQVGAFSGSVVLEPAASLQITADGAWSVTIKPLLSARQIGSEPSSGKGSEVLVYAGPPVRASVSHNGQRTFSIEYWSNSTHTAVVNEVGSYQGVIDVPGNPITVMAIVADGTWTINPG